MKNEEIAQKARKYYAEGNKKIAYFLMARVLEKRNKTKKYDDN